MNASSDHDPQACGITIDKTRLHIVFLCLACLVGIHSVLLTFSSINNSPTTDEVTFLSSGISHWYLGRFELCAVNPPLVRMVAAIPVLALNPNVDWSNANTNPASRSDLAVGRKFIENNASNITTYFSIARMACIPFSILGMFVCFLWARDVYGIFDVVTATHRNYIIQLDGFAPFP